MGAPENKLKMAPICQPPTSRAIKGPPSTKKIVSGPEWQFPDAAVSEDVSSMQVEQPFIEVTISSVSVAPQKHLPTKLVFLCFSNFFSEGAAPGVVTQHSPSLAEALIRIELQRVVCRVGKIAREFRSCKLRVDDNPILRESGQPRQRASFVAYSYAIQEIGEQTDVVIRKIPTSRGKPPDKGGSGHSPPKAIKEAVQQRRIPTSLSYLECV